LRKISIAIPTHDFRWQYTQQTISAIHNDERISEIVLNDDNSPMPIYRSLEKVAQGFSKVKLSRNATRKYVFRNKYSTLSLCSNEWCILFDSDNILDKKFIDTLYRQEPWNNNYIYQPCFAKPKFNFKEWQGIPLDKEIVGSFVQKRSMFNTMLNAMNCFVNKNKFTSILKESFDSPYEPYNADSLWINYNLLKSGMKIFIVPDLEYTHTVHEGSFFKVYKGESDCTKIENLIKELK
jgi:hypothetical protein